MKFATWAYPWDLCDEGISNAVEQLADIGINEVNLATNYHSVQAFTPHNPARRTFFARASSYFQPSDEYGVLKPVPNEQMGDADWLDEIVDRFRETDLKLNSWTIGCHNSRLGMQHPETTFTSPFGDNLVFGLCPSNPDVQHYLRTLLSDLDSRAPFERIELETFDYFYGTGFGWHHDKYHVELGRLGEFLFGLCFCDHCREYAAAADVNVKSARKSCRNCINAIIAGELPPDTSIEAWLRTNPDVANYVDVRLETLRTVFDDLNEAVDGAELGYYIGLLNVEDSWVHGADLESLAKPLDYYTAICYEQNRQDAVDVYLTAEQLTPDIPVHAGVLPGHPAVKDEQTLCEIVDGLANAGCERISFYNYGLISARNLEWIRTSIDQYL